jgi:SNF2 family DNA or RNA helicase
MSATPNETKPDFDEEFLQTLGQWKEKNKIRDDDAVYLLVELFRIHQKHWDALRQRQMPSLDRFRTDITAVTESSKSFREKLEELIEELAAHPAAVQIKTLPLSEATRLLIADDVGIGKTIEALLIIKELLERRIIKRFAVVCLPHLCDQWQREIREKIGMDAVIIRSSTQARLDREIVGDTSVYQYYPFQIISIDYIKSDTRRAVFIEEAPEMVVVDEAHT